MSRLIKRTLLWMIPLVGLVAVYQWVGLEESPRRVEFSEFMADLRASRIERLEIADRTDHDEFRIRRVSHDGVIEHVIAVGKLGDDVKRELEQHAIPVRYV